MLPTEAEESRMLMQYMKLKGYRFTHIKNETGRSARGARGQNWRAIWDARDGVSKGFPDFIVIANNNVIAIELKRTKGGTASPEQRAWLEALSSAGIPAAVCKGAAAAIDFIDTVVSSRQSE